MKTAIPFKKLPALILVMFAAACHKSNSTADSGNGALQYKWTLISRTATFPTAPSPWTGFQEVDYPNDYFDFRKNDSVYSYVTDYLPFSIDTVLYRATASSVTFYINQDQNGFIFMSQDTSGRFHDTTVAQILTLNDSLLVLSFTSIEPITNLNGPGITTYFPGTMIDTLRR